MTRRHEVPHSPIARQHRQSRKEAINLTALWAVGTYGSFRAMKPVFLNVYGRFGRAGVIPFAVAIATAGLAGIYVSIRALTDDAS